MAVNSLTLYMPGSSVGIQVWEGSQLHEILVSQGANSIPSAPGQTVRQDPFPQYVDDQELAAALSGVGGGAVASVNGRTGAVVLAADDINGLDVASVAAVEAAPTVAPAGVWDFTQAPTVAGSPIGGGGPPGTDLGWYDVRDYGAVGNGTADDTAALNAAMNAARMSGGRRGGTVFIPPGFRCAVSAPINLYTAVSIVGGGWWLDTTYYRTSAIVALAGFTGTAIVKQNPDGGTVLSPPGPDYSWHAGRIEKIAVVGNGPTGPHGIDPGWNGEASSIDNVTVHNCKSGIYLTGTQASATLKAVTLFDNAVGLNCDGVNGTVRVFGLSGDNNGSLVRIKGGLSCNVTITSVKAESFVAGKGDPVFDVTDLDGGSLTIIGGWCDTDTARDAVIKLSKTAATTNHPRVVVMGLHSHASYANLIRDTIGGKAVARGLDGLGYPAVFYNVPLMQEGQGSQIIGYGKSLRGAGSWGGLVDLLTMETDDTVSFKSAAGGQLRTELGGDRVRWNNTGLGFYGTAPVARPTALTVAAVDTVDATYGTQEAAVINNLRTRVNELETKLKALGLLS